MRTEARSYHYVSELMRANEMLAAGEEGRVAGGRLNRPKSFAYGMRMSVMRGL